MKRRLLYVTTYAPTQSQLGGAAWVDTRVLRELRELFDVTTFTVADPDTPGDVQLELRGSRRAQVSTVARMLLKREAYQEAKFRWDPGFGSLAGRLAVEAKLHDLVVSSQWPALLLTEAAGVEPDLHIAHNVDWILARSHDPQLFRLLRNAAVMERRERQLLGRPRVVLALSRRDTERLRSSGLLADHLVMASSGARPRPRHRVRTVGFLGKATWPPNADAIDRLVRQVVPRVNASLKHPLEVVIAGRGSERYGALDGVRSLGPVDAVEEFYSEVDVVAVPRFGEATGVSIKLLEAIEHGVQVLAPESLLDDVGLRTPVGSKTGQGDDSVDSLSGALVEYAVSGRHVELELVPESEREALRVDRLAAWLGEQPSGSPQAHRDLYAVLDQGSTRLLSTPARLAEIMRGVSAPRYARVQTVNLHHMVLASRLPDFRRALAEADYLTADGWPVQSYYRRRLGMKVARVTGSGWLRTAIDAGTFANARVGLLGSSSTAGRELAAALSKHGGMLAFAEHGHRQNWSAPQLAKRLKAARVDVLLVAVTPPTGEILGGALRKLGAVERIIAVGGAVEMLFGSTQRAPRILQVLRLEWMYRLLLDPRKMTRRYIFECLPFYFRSLLPATHRPGRRMSEIEPASSAEG